MKYSLEVESLIFKNVLFIEKIGSHSWLVNKVTDVMAYLLGDFTMCQVLS